MSDETLKPVSHRIFCKRMVKLGFEGPFAGGKHLFFVRDGHRFTAPNPHSKAIGVSLLQRLLKQYGVTPRDWNSIK